MTTDTKAKTIPIRSKPFIDNHPEDVEDGENEPEPKPGSTDRAKEPLPTDKRSRPRKLLTPDEITTEETNLRDKYPHIVKGSLNNATKGNPTDDFTDHEVHKYRHKRSVLIKCQTGPTGAGAGCESHRRIATSDLAQVQHCEDCTRLNRNKRKRARRAATKKPE